VIVDEKGIKGLWKEYMEKLMNEEIKWDHGISAEVKEGPADCIRIGEVFAALKKVKRHKALRLSTLSAEMIQATEYIGTQWLMDLCNGIVKEGCKFKYAILCRYRIVYLNFHFSAFFFLAVNIICTGIYMCSAFYELHN